MRYNPIALKFVRLFLKFMIVMCGFSALFTMSMMLFISEVPISEQWPIILGWIGMYAIFFSFLKFMLYVFSESK